MQKEKGNEIRIVLPNKDECISLTQQQIIQQRTDILKLLHEEDASPSQWILLANKRLGERDYEGFEEILQEGTSKLQSTSQNPKTDKHRTQNRLLTLHNSLGGYYLWRSMEARDLREKEDYEYKVVQEITKADKIEHKEKQNWFNKAFSNFSKGNIDLAKSNFENVSETGSNHITLFGKALITYNLESYNESLDLFRTILKEAPGNILPIRMAIGLCLVGLGELDLARKAFLRQREIDPQNDYCLAFLGVLDIRGDKYAENGLKSLDLAFKMNPNNELALLYLGEHLLVQGEYEKAEKMARRGIQLLEKFSQLIIRKGLTETEILEKRKFGREINQLRSRFFFLIGKINHIQQRYNEALKFYSQAVSSNSQNYAAVLCLGQMKCHLKAFQEAIKLFESLALIPIYQYDFDLQKILGQCYNKMHDRDLAVECFQRSLLLNSQDVEVHIEIAGILEAEDPLKAIYHYGEAEKLITNNEEHPLRSSLCEIHNNKGVLLTSLQRYPEGKDSIQKALNFLNSTTASASSTNLSISRLKALRITVMFNLGYWHEIQGRFGEATGFYKKIIQPKYQENYVDAYIRLAFLASKRGNLKGAVNYAKKATHIGEHGRKAIPTKCQMANFCLEMDDLKSATSIFKEVLQDTNHRDNYARVALGNTIFNNASNLRKRHSVETQNQEYKHALETYIKALEYDDKSIYAALGIGNCLLQFNQISEGKEIYKMLRENHPEVYAGWMNSAHIMLAEGEQEKAIMIYNKCLNRWLGGKNLAVELLIARAYYDQEKYLEAQKILQKLIVRSPPDLILKYNLALCLQARALLTFKKGERKVSETKEAIKNLKICIPMLKQMHRMEQEIHSYLPLYLDDATKEWRKREVFEISQGAEERRSICENFLSNSKDYLHLDMERERERAVSREQQERKVREMREREEELRKAEEEEEMGTIEADGLEEEREKVIEQLGKAWGENKKGGSGKRKKMEKSDSEEEDFNELFNEEEEYKQGEMKDEGEGVDVLQNGGNKGEQHKHRHRHHHKKRKHGHSSRKRLKKNLEDAAVDYKGEDDDDEEGEAEYMGIPVPKLNPVDVAEGVTENEVKEEEPVIQAPTLLEELSVSKPSNHEEE